MRYARQELLFGKENQQKLGNSRVAIIGVGAIGTVASELLARAGIGKLILIDRDVIELSNLQRQTLFEEKDIGKSKAIVAKNKLAKINSEINITHHLIHLNSENISILNHADLILDCTDNMKTRFLINDYCKKNNIKWIYSAAIKTTGYVMPIFPQGPCISCFTNETSLETCDTVGVINTITTSIAALQATLAIKIILGKNTQQLLYKYDIWEQEFRKLKISKNKNCNTCKGNYGYLNQKENIKTIKFCSSGRYQIKGKKIDITKIKERLEKIDTVTLDYETLKFKNILLFKDGRALIKAKNEKEAISSYSRFIGN